VDSRITNSGSMAISGTRIRLSLVEVHLCLGASTIVSVAREMFALVSVCCRAVVHPQKPSISIYKTYLSSFRNFALGGIDH
jgi:hypothetical protein